MTASSIVDNLRFLRALISRPKNIGAIAPSSPALARAIANQIDPQISGPVLELGPGTGVVTQALLERGIAPERLVLIEYDEELARYNAQRYPGAQVIQGDAFALEMTLGTHRRGPFAAVVSGLPLLNFPVAMRRQLIGGVLARLAPGAPLVQFSYGTNAPVKAPPGCSLSRAALVWANIPPARVWVYRNA